MAAQDVRKYFFHTKNAVTSEWKNLASCLDPVVFDGPEISNIEGRNRDDKSRCMDLLQEWKKKKGNGATVEVLMDALSNAGLTEVLHGLTSTFPELARYQVTMAQPSREQPAMVQPQPAPLGQPQSVSIRQPIQVTGAPPSNSDEQPGYRGEAPKKLFIVHGGEDKDSLVEPLAEKIVAQGVPKENVFYDKWSIEHAQSIKESIALAIHDWSCKLAVIVISEDMMKKYWPKKEFEEFLKRGIRFFPIFYGVAPADVRINYSPTLADTRGVEIPRTGNKVDDNLIAETASEIRKILQETGGSQELPTRPPTNVARVEGMQANQDVMDKEMPADWQQHEMTPYFKVIAKEMPADWQQLAVNLGLPWAQIRAVNRQYSGECWLCCHEVLDMWHKTNGREATKEDLIEVVRETGNQDVAEKLEDL